MSAKAVVLAFIQRINEAVSGGRADPLALVDENLVVHVNGTTPLSGDYAGQRIVRNVLLNTAKRRIKSASVKLVDSISNGEQVATLLDIRALTFNERTYNDAGDPSGCLFRVRDGKISEIHLFPDTNLIETVVFNQVFVPD